METVDVSTRPLRIICKGQSGLHTKNGKMVDIVNLVIYVDGQWLSAPRRPLVLP